jgi:hypothetical protein
MATATETSMGPSAGRTALLWLVAFALVAAIALLLGSPLLAAGSATGHAQFHAILALAALVPAGGLVARRGRPRFAT